MAISKIQKIQLIGITDKRNDLLDILQNFGFLQIIDISEETPEERKDTKDIQDLHKTDLEFANVEFAIKLLTPYGEKKGFLEGPIVLSEKEIEKKAKKFDYGDIVDKCTEIEEVLTRAKNKLSAVENEYELFKPWEKLPIKLENLEGTGTSQIVFGQTGVNTYESTKKAISKISKLIEIEKVHEDEKNTLFYTVFNRDLEKDVSKVLSESKFTETELPKGKGLMMEHLSDLKKEADSHKKDIEKEEKKLTKLAKNLDNLKITHDYMGWQKEKMEATQNFENTQYSFVLNGWVPLDKLDSLEEAFMKKTKEFDIKKLKLEKDEQPPVIIKNSAVLGPFETLTKMFGLPKYGAIDPTPFLSIFFIIFFALCLTDAGYGIIMAVLMGLALKFMKMGEGARKLVKLLMYGGLVTAIIGTLFGGWFGFLPEDMPEFLTYTAANGEKMFLLQTINSVTNPITVLILALSLGFIQILLGVFMKLVHDFTHNNKLAAVLDTGTWAYMLTGIGVFVVASAGLLPEIAVVIGKWWVISGAVFLVLTQGRDKKNIFAKLISGVLSLYGLVNYMSDVLSYSRLLALGLATSIIALAVNVIVELLFGIPYVGWFFAIIVFVGGHIFNLLINALGSFIHSGRLQFVEFFGKFMEAGGKDFKPFSKKSKYVYIKNN